MLQESESEFSGDGGDALHARAKAIKGLVELVLGNVQSGTPSNHRTRSLALSCFHVSCSHVLPICDAAVL